MISFSASVKMTETTFPPKDRFPKMKPTKEKKKGVKTPCDSSSTTSKLLPLLEHWQSKPVNLFFLIFRLFQQQFLDCSIQTIWLFPMPESRPETRLFL